YLFGQTTQDHSENEIVFAIVPHIIRSTDVNEINQRAIDIGTATTIGLRRAPRPVSATSSSSPQPGQNGTPSIVPADQTPSQPPVRPAVSSPQNAGSGSAPSFLFDPPTIQVKKGDTFPVNLLISGAQNVYSVPVQLNYNPNLLQLVNVSNGSFLSQDGQVVTL